MQKFLSKIFKGPPDDPGINPRALATLFEEAERRKPDWEFSFTVSMLEIYNKNIRYVSSIPEMIK